MKNMMDRLDPELVEPLEGLMAATGGGFSLHDIPATRELLDGLIAAIKADVPSIDGVEAADHRAPGPAGDVAVRVYRPAGVTEPLPALLWMHAGGYVLGGIEMDDLMCAQLAKDVGCAVASVEYRLAPENPYPAALDDCAAALAWLGAGAAGLAIDASRIAIGGASAGGGLAAALALKARDAGPVKPVFQLLIYPAIDDSNVELPGDTVPDTLFWDRESTRLGWLAYLGAMSPGGDDVPAYAAAVRAEDLTGLPPAFVAVGELDQFLPECLDYVRRLVGAEVPVELHVYPGACHALDVFAPMAQVSLRFVGERNRALKAALGL